MDVLLLPNKQCLSLCLFVFPIEALPLTLCKMLNAKPKATGGVLVKKINRSVYFSLILLSFLSYDSCLAMEPKKQKDPKLIENLQYLQDCYEDICDNEGPLQEAARKGFSRFFEGVYALKQGKDLDARDTNGETVLMRVAMVGDAAAGLISLLLDNGANPNAQDNSGNTVLNKMWFLRDFPDVIASLLVKNKANVNIQNKWGTTPLASLTRQYDRNISKITSFFLANKADPNIQNESGHTALMNVSYCGDDEYVSESATSVRMLLSGGARPDTKDKKGDTALMKAAEFGDQNIEILSLLLSGGADPNIVSIWGDTALLKATYHPECGTKITELLLQRGANTNVQLRPQGGAILHGFASRTQNEHTLACTDLFLRYNANPMLLDKSGQTAFMRFCNKGNAALPVVKLFLEHAGPEASRWVNAVISPGGGCALLEAVRQDEHSFELVKFLLENGANPNENASFGTSPDQTPLGKATFLGDVSKNILTFLLAKGANPNITSPNGEAILHALSRRLHNQAMASAALLLLKHKADPMMTNRERRTAFMEFCSRGDMALPVIKACVELAGPNAAKWVNTSDNMGNTPLMAAVGLGDQAQGVVSLLLKNGARKDDKNRQSKTALDRANSLGVRGVKIVSPFANEE